MNEVEHLVMQIHNCRKLFGEREYALYVLEEKLKELKKPMTSKDIATKCKLYGVDFNEKENIITIEPQRLMRRK